MTKFDKSKFSYHGGYLTYNTGDGNPKFVARFKYSGPFSKACFQKQLVKNHSVEEYFHKLEIDHVAPLRVLEQADRAWYEAELEKFRTKTLAKYSR